MHSKDKTMICSCIRPSISKAQTEQVIYCLKYSDSFLCCQPSAHIKALTTDVLSSQASVFVMQRETFFKETTSDNICRARGSLSWLRRERERERGLEGKKERERQDATLGAEKHKCTKRTREEFITKAPDNKWVFFPRPKR